MLVTTIDYEQATPSLSQAQRMKKFSQAGRLNEDSMLAIMSEEKKPEKFSLTLTGTAYASIFQNPIRPCKWRTPSSSCLRHGRRNASAARSDKTEYTQPAGQSICPAFSFLQGGIHVYQYFQIHTGRCGLQTLHRVYQEFGCTACGCPWMAERIEAGVVGYAEVVRQMFPHDKRLMARLEPLIRDSPVCSGRMNATGSAWRV